MHELATSPVASSRWHVLRTRTFWLGVVLVIAIGLLSYYFEDVKQQFPPLIAAQLWAYGKMAHAQARAPRPKWVVGVEIDYDTFFGDMKRTGPEDITDRTYLAQLVRNAVDANPAVIALDINLVREETDAGSTAAANAALWQAIQYAASKKVPVVLTFALESKSMRPLNNIFGEDQVPLCTGSADPFAPRAGFDNAPEDKRKVPLVVGGHPGGGAAVPCRAFGLQIVDAYESATRMPHDKKTVERLAPLIEEGRFAFTTFMPQDEFNPPISARLVYHNDPQALERLRHRIVVVGGNRTGWPTAYVNPTPDEKIDYHRSPEDLMPGMYVHANYVEGLLDDRYLKEFSRLAGAIIDMVLATLIILAFECLKKDPLLRLAVIVVLLLVPVVLSLALLDRGYTFDWVIPVLLSFLHPVLEKYADLVSDPLRRHAHE